MEKNKKILVTYSGHARTYKQALPTHIEMFVLPLSVYFNVEVKFTLYVKENIGEQEEVDIDFISKLFKDFKTRINLIEESSSYQKSPKSMFSLMQLSLEKEEHDYDFIIRIRPDLKFLSPLNPNEISDFDIIFPRFGHFVDGRNDQFFIIRSEKIKESGFRISDFAQKSSIEHPETLLKHYISSLCLSERFIDSIDFVILRKDKVDDQRIYYRIAT